MTVRDDLVAQVQQALRVAVVSLPSSTGPLTPADYLVMANAAVDTVAVFVFEQLAAGVDG